MYAWKGEGYLSITYRVKCVTFNVSLTELSVMSIAYKNAYTAFPDTKIFTIYFMTEYIRPSSCVGFARACVVCEGPETIA